ncbi:MAG TPA: hypothetical protein HPP87_13020 [Planctomycetes bacterium]|nr:hypothetical protein [Planctomycetota bacterium]
MQDFNKSKFKEYWRKTEIVREYEQTLFTFADMELPYLFTAQHSSLSDRVVVRKGTVIVKKPHIMLPGRSYGPQFEEGFEHADAMPAEAVYMLRAMGLPYSQIANHPAARQRIEYGSLQNVIDRLNSMMEKDQDNQTGLIKGDIDGEDISLMRYTIGLIVKSAPGNIGEFIEHLRRQRGEPIRPDEKISDEDIRRLFE